MLEIKQLIDNGANIVATVKSVNRNNTSRKMCFFVCYENKLLNINDEISSLLDLKLDKNGYLIVQGGGQNMFYLTLTKFLKKLDITDDEIEKIYFKSQII